MNPIEAFRRSRLEQLKPTLSKSDGTIEPIPRKSTVSVTFYLHYPQSCGLHVFLSGSIKELGNWDENKGKRMHWDDETHHWKATVKLTPQVQSICSIIVSLQLASD